MKAQTTAIVAIVAVLGLVLASTSAITYSWWSDSEEADIEITTGYLDVSVSDIYLTNGNDGREHITSFSDVNKNIVIVADSNDMHTAVLEYTVTFKTTIDAQYKISIDAIVNDVSTDAAKKTQVSVSNSVTDINGNDVSEDPFVWTKLAAPTVAGTESYVTYKVTSTVTFSNVQMYASGKLSVDNDITQFGAVSETIVGGTNPVVEGIEVLGTDGNIWNVDVAFQGTFGNTVLNTDIVKVSDSGDNFQINLSLDSGATFNSATVKVTIPGVVLDDGFVVYLGGGEQPAATTVTDDGTNTCVTFTTSHFSEFMFFDLKVDSVDELVMFEGFVNDYNVTFEGKTVSLASNLNLKGVEWTPIGSESVPFMGTFDGKDKTVSNLCVDVDGVAGFFGKIKGTVKNIGFENAHVTGTSEVGVVAGDLHGKIINASVEGSEVYGNHYVGGIAGFAYGSINHCEVSDSEVKCIATTTDDGDKAGGILGYLGEGSSYTISENTVSSTTICGYRNIGGIVGTGHTMPDNCEVNNITLIHDRSVVKDEPSSGNQSGPIMGTRVGGMAANSNCNTIAGVTTDDLKIVEYGLKWGFNEFTLVNGVYDWSTSLNGVELSGENRDEVVIKFDGAYGCGYSSMTFTNLTMVWPNENYKGLQHSDEITYNNCAIIGQPFLYGVKEVFNGCTFTQTSSDAYNVWTYGAIEVTFNECVFNSAGKSVLIYAESNTLEQSVTFKDCAFKASSPVEGKAAIEIDSSLIKGYNVSINNCTSDGFADGSVSCNDLWNNKKGVNTIVSVNNVQVWPVVSIYDADDLALFAKLVNGFAGTYHYTFEDMTVTMMDDVDLDGISWTPIGSESDPFMGTFDGNGYTISNLAVSGDDYVGFFGCLSGSVKNLTIKDATLDGKEFVGAVTGRISSNAPNVLISNVKVIDSRITGTHFIGGISGWSVGSITNCTVSGCYIAASTEVIGGYSDNGDKVGGITGFVNSVAGNYKADYLVYDNIVTNCTIKAYRDVGGVIGTAYMYYNLSDRSMKVENNKVESCNIIIDQNVEPAYNGVKDTNVGEIVGRSISDSEVSSTNIATDNVISYTKKSVSIDSGISTDDANFTVDDGQGNEVSISFSDLPEDTITDMTVAASNEGGIVTIFVNASNDDGEVTQFADGSQATFMVILDGEYDAGNFIVYFDGDGTQPEYSFAYDDEDKVTTVTIVTTHFSEFKIMPLLRSIDDITTGGFIKLTEDVNLDKTLVIPEGLYVYMDLNGKTITGSIHKSVGPVIKNNGYLRIFNGTITSGANNGGSAIINNGVAIVENCVLNGAPNADGSWPSYAVNNTGSMTITDSKITSYHGAVASYGDGAIVTMNNSDIDMSGIIGFTNHGIYTYNNGNVVVNGGNIVNNAKDQGSTGGSVINGNVTVNDGNFSGRIENYYGTPVINGGTFSVNPSRYVSAGSVSSEVNGVYVVVEVVLPEGITVESFGDNVIFDGETYYSSFKSAIESIHLTDKNTLWVKPGADMGMITHLHVCSDLTIYGNGAYISGGEADLEVDTYKYCHNGSNSCSGLVEDMDLMINSLHGIAVWGQRSTEYTINITLDGCYDLNRVYISGTLGTTNVTIRDCTYDGTTGYRNTAVYTNNPGTIIMDNVVIKEYAIGLNQNNKSDGTQVIILTDCTFIDCATKTIVQEVNASGYAAPVRVVASASGAVSKLSTENCIFIYSDGEGAVDGDYLFGDRRDGSTNSGTVYWNGVKQEQPISVIA